MSKQITPNDIQPILENHWNAYVIDTEEIVREKEKEAAFDSACLRGVFKIGDIVIDECSAATFIISDGELHRVVDPDCVIDEMMDDDPEIKAEWKSTFFATEKALQAIMAK